MTFEEAWAYSSTIKGWYTEAEARLLAKCFYEDCPAARFGRVCEVGSYRGRSTSVLAAYGATVHAIDPFILAPGSPNDTPESHGKYVSDTFQQHIAADFLSNMARFPSCIVLHPCRTEEARYSIPMVGLLHIDGDHVDGVFQDIKILKHRLYSGGIAVFHDYEAIHTKFTRVKEAVDALGWEVVGRADSAIAVRKP